MLRAPSILRSIALVTSLLGSWSGCGGGATGVDASIMSSPDLAMPPPPDMAKPVEDLSVIPDMARMLRKPEDFEGVYAVTTSVLSKNTCPMLGGKPFDFAPASGRFLRASKADPTHVALLTCVDAPAMNCPALPPKQAIWSVKLDQITNEAAVALFSDPATAPPDCIGALLFDYRYDLGGVTGRDLIGVYAFNIALLGPGCAAVEDLVKKDEPNFKGVVNGCEVRFDVIGTRQ